VEAHLQCPQCQKRLEGLANFCPACGEDLRGLTPMSDTLSGPWTGKVIDGRYRLIEKLGEGGMGAVYKVEHVRMGKVLALKVLRPDLAIDKKMKARFHQEARVVSKLGHPNTIQVFDFGELEDGALYIAMEYLPGRDLAWMLRAHGPISEERAISIGLQVLASLAEAHDLGIVHRDIKPANVMLLRRKDGGDTVKVLDFGIAKLIESADRKHITGFDFVGTPQYMSPEQGKGEALDARSDLYAVATMLFELVSGKSLFDGPSPMSIVSKHLTEPPPRVAQVAPDRIVSPGFENVLRRALAKDPDDRYPGADQMRLALERARLDISTTVSDYTPSMELLGGQVACRADFDQFERSLRLRRVIAPLLTGVLLAGGGTATALHFLNRPPPGPRISTVEQEPNNDPQRATLIPLGEGVRGMIGAPLSEAQSDLDVFRVEVPADMAVSISLSGVPDMNLVLEAFSQSGEEKLRHLVAVDDGRVGEGERVDGLRVRQGPLYLRIQERRHASEPVRAPRETSKNGYTLTVETADDVDGRLEWEPDNDRLEVAVAQPPGRAIRAFTGSALPVEAASFDSPSSSVDIFRVEPSGGKVFALVVPPPAGRLAVLDELRVEAWKRAVAAGGRATLPNPQETRGHPVLVPLEEGRLGHAVRVFPPLPPKAAKLDLTDQLDRIAPPGSAYFVAFLVDGDGGTDGVFDLLEVLEGREVPGHRARVLELVRAALKGSVHLAAFNVRAGDLLANEAGP
jgi:tRNA A-37 threonylcarbamoyl transferase component Bud32